MAKKLVSVIVPVYNIDAYVYKCIDSLINQTLKDIEIICINDCSEDDSLFVLNKLAQKDNRIKIIDNETHLGVAKSRNLGLEAATGEFISFVDGDDYLDLDFLEKLYNKAIETNSEIVKGLCKRVYLDGQVVEHAANVEVIKAKNNGLFIPAYYNHCFVTSIYKKELLDSYEIKFPELNNGEDIIFLLKALCFAKKFECVDNTYYNYYQRPDSASFQYSEKNAYSVLQHFVYQIEFINTLEIEKNNYIDFINNSIISAFEDWFQYFKNLNFSKNFYKNYVIGLINLYKKITYSDEIFKKKKYLQFLQKEDIDKYLEKVFKSNISVYLFNSYPIFSIKNGFMKKSLSISGFKK